QVTPSALCTPLTAGVQVEVGRSAHCPAPLVVLQPEVAHASRTMPVPVLLTATRDSVTGATPAGTVVRRAATASGPVGSEATYRPPAGTPCGATGSGVGAACARHQYADCTAAAAVAGGAGQAAATAQQTAAVRASRANRRR